MDTLDEFARAMNAIDSVKDRADKVARSLEQQRDDAEQRLRDAEQDLQDSSSGATLTSDPSAAEEAYLERIGELDSAYYELRVWLQETSRRTVIAYCTVFENFLHSFLVEQAIARPIMLERYVRGQLRLSVQLPASLNRGEVDDCISTGMRSFQNVSDVNKVYNAFFQKSPIGNFYPNNIFRTRDEAMTYIDIRILFAMRHQFVHRNGEVDAQYQRAMNGKDYRARFHEELRSRYLSTAPGPDDILVSKAIVPRFGTKREELAYSLRQYAKYVVDVCT